MAAPVPAPRPSAPTPKPAQATSARTPTSTPSTKQGSKPAAGMDTAPGTMELKGLSEFAPPGPIAEFLDSRKRSTVNVRFGSLAQGQVDVATLRKGAYRVRRQPIPLSHPMLAHAGAAIPGVVPSLVLNVEGRKMTGQVGLSAGKKIENLSTHIRKSPEMLGLFGITITSLPALVNALEGGSLHIGVKGVPMRLGSAFSGKFSIEAINDSVIFDGDAAINVKGLANGTLELKRAADGAITGKANVGLTLPKNFSGGVDVAWDGAVITGSGKVGYKGEKFSGEVTLYLMEKNQAAQLAEQRKAPEGAAPQPVGTDKPRGKRPSKVEYVVFGEGDLGFAFTEWLNGTAHVIADPKGNITVIGKITPQKEFVLFDQKDYVKQLFKVEARASYGIPVVGNIFIFANVGMDLFAKLGPAKFYNIVIDGMYSTDPKIAKNFSIRGSLNISAGAGARLRAEAGAGLEILDHDIKAGAGLNGIAGVKAYAEATPIVGYREKAAEGQDKKGEWFIRGELEIAAQPFLGLSGDVFVEIDAPWWSPVPDKKWTWPLFNKEYPLGGTLGILASVDYIFGSGQWPKFDFKPAAFDSSKFMTDLYADKAKSGGGKELEQKGKWQEENSRAAEPPPKTSPKGNASHGKPAPLPAAKSRPVASRRSGKPVDPNARTKEGKTVKQLQEEAIRKGKKPAGAEAKGGKGEPAKKDKEKPTDKWERGATAVRQALAYAEKNGISEGELNRILKSIQKRREYGFSKLVAIPEKDVWVVEGSMSPGKQVTKVKKRRPQAQSKVTFGRLNRGYGTRMTADPLGPDKWETGSTVSGGTRRELRDKIGGRQSLYRVGHLLNNHLGGSGSDWANLTPLTPSANATHLTRAERDIKNAVEGGTWVYYEVWPTYPASQQPVSGKVHPEEGWFASQLNLNWYKLKSSADDPDKLVRDGSVIAPGPITNVPPYP